MTQNHNSNKPNPFNKYMNRYNDLSLNSLFPILTDNSSNNLNFFSLDRCNKKINEKVVDTSSNLDISSYKSDINLTLDKFDMTVKKILDLIDDYEKEKGFRDISNNCRPIITTLDRSNRYNDITTPFSPSYTGKQNLVTLLDKYNLDYKKLHSKNFSGWESNSNDYNFGTLDSPYSATENPPMQKFEYKLPEPKVEIKKEFININVEIKNIKDLIQLCDDYPIAMNVEYNINMATIHEIKKPLIELDGMVGMNTLKESIVDQILYFIQNLHNVNSNNEDFMHTVIYGPPGTGKTEIAKIMGKIFSKLGVLKKGSFKKVTRSDLIAGYLGQTALKTRDAMKDSLGGVLFIDEAYALGNTEKRDSFAKECIDTLCEGLSDNKQDLMVIIAGYEKELKECFFNYNDGLESRFTWRFKIDDYSAQELKEIFEKKVKDAGWSITDTINVSWFEQNMDYFKYFGRDMETLLSKTKVAHSRRVFCKSKEDKTKLILKDLENGLKVYLQNEEVQDRKKSKDFDNIAHMYN